MEIYVTQKNKSIKLLYKSTLSEKLGTQFFIIIDQSVAPLQSKLLEAAKHETHY